LIPVQKVFQIRNGKKVSKETNMFPGYVYIEAALVGEVPHLIRNVTGVIGFLGAEKRGEPLPVRQNEMNRILGVIDDLVDAEEEISIPFKVGEAVKVTDGPFNGDGQDFRQEDTRRAWLPPSGKRITWNRQPGRSQCPFNASLCACRGLFTIYMNHG
jgi:transcription antitermination factor NusG